MCETEIAAQKKQKHVSDPHQKQGYPVILLRILYPTMGGPLPWQILSVWDGIPPDKKEPPFPVGIIFSGFEDGVLFKGFMFE